MAFDWKRNTLWCDWTEYQGQLDAKAVEAEGFTGVWLKSSGRTARRGMTANPFYCDPWFAENMAALRATSLVAGAYHYLVPGFPGAQAGIVYDRLTASGGHRGVAVEVDAEEAGLSCDWVLSFVDAWLDLTNGYPITVYTRRNLWKEWGDKSLSMAFGGDASVYLHDAHWVPAGLRMDPALPYASQQVRGVMPEWWEPYGGKSPMMLQFTDNALVAGKRTMASVAPWTKEQLTAMLIR